MSIYLKASHTKGSVTTRGYEHWIKVDDIDFSGISTPAEMRLGHAMDRNSSSPRFGQVTIVKSLDESSNDFFEAAHSGTVFPELEFHYVKSGDNSKVYGKLILHDVMVTQYADKVSGTSETMPRELIRLAYSKLQRTFVPKDGSGSPISTGYDIEQAKAL